MVKATERACKSTPERNIINAPSVEIDMKSNYKNQTKK
jgi:hypothetical protein